MRFIPVLRVLFLRQARSEGSRRMVGMRTRSHIMLRRCLSAALVLFVLTGFVFAETYRGIITKIDDKEVKITVRKKGEKEGVEKTFKVGKDVKVMRRKGKDAEPESMTIGDVKEAIEKAKGKVKGVFATVETEGEGSKETATKITITPIGKRKKKDS
jgi:hypothetical protein